ncbi:MAG: lipoyl synthase [Pirellulales bacterium]
MAATDRKKTMEANSGTQLPADHVERKRLPRWLRYRLPSGGAVASYGKTGLAVVEHGLHTVCEEARCPNLHECWGRSTATFMVGGKTCTRGCRFCAVETRRQPEPVDPREPERLADAVVRMGLGHAVVTVVNRDDMLDGGAAHFRSCLDAVHARSPKVTLELLSSDLAGSRTSLERLLHGAPLDVFAHNVECVPRLDRVVRDRRASFQQSLRILQMARQLRTGLLTKSSLMVGLGETDAELTAAMVDLRQVGVDILTLGQYIAPGKNYLAVDRYVCPERFERWYEEAMAAGFRAVASGPMVRSSYRAEELLRQARSEQDVVSTVCDSM